MADIVAHSAAGRKDSPTAFIDDLPITCASRNYVMNEIGGVISAREYGHYIAVTNPETMYHGQRIPSMGEYIRNSDFSVCDGVGVILAGLSWGHVVPRFPGPTLHLLASEWGIEHGWRHFYYGGKKGVADLLATRLKERYPGLIVCGTYCPPFGEISPEEDERIVQIINDAKPDIVWVGLGVPKQEKWIAAHQDRLQVPWLIGVGASFDYHAGTVSWAPALIRAMGMEWLFRLIVEPKVRARRTWLHLVYVVQTLLKGIFTLAFLRPKRIAENRTTNSLPIMQP